MASQHALWAAFEEALDDALSSCKPGDLLMVCRDNAQACGGSPACPMCARIVVGPAMHMPAVMAQIRTVGRA